MVAVVALVVTASCGQRYEPGTDPGRKPMPRTRPASGPAAVPAAGESGSLDDAASDTSSITGVVRLSPDLAGRVPRGAVLYLIARERAEGGAPYAFKRIPVPEFPHTFSLGQANIAKMLGEGIVFADIPEMYVVAKIDQDGMVGSQPGDLEGRCLQNPVAAGARDLEILIDRVN